MADKYPRTRRVVKQDHVPQLTKKTSEEISQ